MAEIKRLNAQIMAIKRYRCVLFYCILPIIYYFHELLSEISRNDDQLNELKTYRSFLSELSPEVLGIHIYLMQLYTNYELAVSKLDRSGKNKCK